MFYRLPGSLIFLWCRWWGEQLATSWEAVYIMPTYQKENLKGKLCCVDCIRTMTQCISLHVSDKGFPNMVGGIPLHWREMGNFVIYLMVETWGKVVLTIWTFLKPKTAFCKYWMLIKIKIGLTCEYKLRCK